jgi:hypothetical protein
MAAGWEAPLQYSPSSAVTGAASSVARVSSPHCATLRGACADPVHALRAQLETAPAQFIQQKLNALLTLYKSLYLSADSGYASQKFFFYDI